MRTHTGCITVRNDSMALLAASGLRLRDLTVGANAVWAVTKPRLTNLVGTASSAFSCVRVPDPGRLVTSWRLPLAALAVTLEAEVFRKRPCCLLLGAVVRFWPMGSLVEFTVAPMVEMLRVLCRRASRLSQC